MSISASEEKQPSKPIELLPDKPSLRELLDRRAVLDEQLDAYEYELDSIMNTFDEDEKLELDTLSLEYMNYHDESEVTPSASEIDYWLEHGKERLHDDTIQALRAMQVTCADAEPIAKEVSIVEAELDAHYGEEFSDYVRSEASKLLSLVDDALVSEQEKKAVPLPDTDGVVLHGNEFEMPTATYVTLTLGYIAHSKDHRYGWAETVYDEIERSRAILERWGVLLDAPKEEADPKSTEDMLAEIEKSELHDAWTLNHTYRHYHNKLLPSKAGQKSMLPMHEWAVQLDEDERSALTRHLQSLDIAKEVTRLEINGLELLPFHYSEQDLRAFLATMPAIAFEGVTGIDFVHDPKNEQSVSNSKLGEGWVALGYHRHSLEENNARITIYVDAFIKRYESNRSVSVAAHSSEYLENTIAHEVGHALHTILPVSMLQEWDHAVRAEEVDVSSYVKQVRETDSHRSYVIEDFADTFAAFYDWGGSREWLEDVAPARFMAMQEIIYRTLPSAPDATARATVQV